MLIEHILPLASRRCPDNVDVFLEDPDVVAIYDYYKDALQQLFQFYATTSTIKTRTAEGGNAKVSDLRPTPVLRGQRGLTACCLRPIRRSPR